MTTRQSLGLALCGRGRMGAMVADIARERGHRVLVQLGAAENPGGRGLSPSALEGVDVVADFSAAPAVLDNVRAAARAGRRVVLGTTGWDSQPAAHEELARIVKESGIGLIASPNFSLGMHLFKKLVETAASLAAADDEIDVWLEEAHHAGKADHPSGTALLLARSMLRRLPHKTGLLTSLPDGKVPHETWSRH